MFSKLKHCNGAHGDKCAAVEAEIMSLRGAFGSLSLLLTASSKVGELCAPCFPSSSIATARMGTSARRWRLRSCLFEVRSAASLFSSRRPRRSVSFAPHVFQAQALQRRAWGQVRGGGG